MTRSIAVSAAWQFSLGLVGLFSLQLALAAEAKPDGVPVSVASVKQQTIYRQVNITGSVTSARVARLSPETSGLVAQLLVDEGDRVAAGTAMMKLDSELAQLKARSADAKALQAQSALDDAKRRLSEARRLGPQRGIAETEVRNLEAEVALDQAALAQASADADYQQALLERHQLNAPFAGVVSRKLAEQGEWLNPGDAVFELVATQDLRLDFAVPEDYLADLKPNTEVSLTLKALPDTPHTGRVIAIVPVTDPGARTFLLRVVATETISGMIPGMSVNAVLNIPTDRHGLVVSRDAVLRQPDGRVVVWTVEQSEDGLIAVEHPVTIGQSFSGRTEILSGLDSAARVVVRGNEALLNHQRVRIISNTANNTAVDG